VIRGARAAASEGTASEAAQAVLDAGGGAIDAIIAGFFAAAGAHPGVLLGPAVALVDRTRDLLGAMSPRLPGSGGARRR